MAIKFFDARDIDECPVHGAELRKEYTFGMQDATVYVYACRCAACVKTEGELAAYYTNYSDAAGCARLIVARENATDIRR